MPAEIWVIFMLSVKEIFCCPCTSTQLPAHKQCVIFKKSMLLLETPDRHSLLVAVNVSASAVVSEYTKVFRRPLSHKSGGLNSGDRVGQLIAPPRSVPCRPKSWFTCCLTIKGHLL